MILAKYYKTDIDYGFSMVLVSLFFNSTIGLTLTELINNQYLPIELNNEFIEGERLSYCKSKGIKYRVLNIVTPDNYDFNITCTVPFREIDFTSFLESGFKIRTIGEEIEENTLKLLLSKVYG